MLIIVVATLGLVGGFLALAIPVIVGQVSQFVHDVPAYLQQATGQNTLVGRLNARFDLARVIQELGTGKSEVSLVGGLLGAGEAVAGAAFSTVIVLVLTVYFLADLPRIKETAYRCVPNSRRPARDPHRRGHPEQGGPVRLGQPRDLGGRGGAHVRVAGRLRGPVRAAAGAVRRVHGPDPGRGVDPGRCGGVPGGPVGVVPDRAGHRRVLRGLPAVRGLSCWSRASWARPWRCPGW